MSIFKQNATTIRLIEAFNYLLDNGIVNSQVDFCNKIDYRSTSFNDVLAGNRNMPKHRIKDAIKIFNINERFIFNGEKEILKTTQNENLFPRESNREVQLLEKTIKALEEAIKAKDLLIDELKEKGHKDSRVKAG